MLEEIKTEKVSEVKKVEDLASMRRSKNINEIHEGTLSFGDRIADKIADMAGSWAFIISFVTVLLLWIGANSIQLLFRPFDPFPFILLNLVLSCVAALQAPIIMMSQNRQETKDRIRAEHDYEINLKAEILIEEVLNRLSKLEENQQMIIEQMNKQEKISKGKVD
jgi:uncharacterized membrane protein